MSLDNEFLNYASWCHNLCKRKAGLSAQHQLLAEVWCQSVNITF